MISRSAWVLLLRRFVPDRGRRYLQAALLMGVLVTVVALPMIYLRGSQPPVKALLLRNYGLNLTLILGLIAAITLSLYAARVARNRKLRGARQSRGRAPAELTARASGGHAQQTSTPTFGQDSRSTRSTSESTSTEGARK